MQRVVSLIPSATEIVCLLGLEAQLVGRSHECDYPPSVQRLPMCTAPAVDVSGSSAEIDRQVKNALRDALAIYRVHDDVLRQVQPGVIVTQAQCDVCAVSLKDVEQAVCQWLDSRPQIVSLEPRTLADVWNDILRVAQVLDVPERGAATVEQLQRRVAAIAERAQRLSSRPTVACIEWLDPLMAGGNWLPELVNLAGGENLFGEAGAHSPWMTWESLRAADPAVIVLLPCGFDIARTREELPALTGLPGWPELRAVRNGRVYLTDGNQFFNRPGPRLVESLEILAEIIHPQSFSFGHAGNGWERLAT